MALRQREWAERETLRLRVILGNKCANCGSTRELEFDCILPKGHKHHKIEWSWRLSFYRRELKNGNLQLLCTVCNSSKGNRMPQLVDTIAGLKIRNYDPTDIPPTIHRIRD